MSPALAAIRPVKQTLVPYLLICNISRARKWFKRSRKRTEAGFPRPRGCGGWVGAGAVIQQVSRCGSARFRVPRRPLRPPAPNSDKANTMARHGVLHHFREISLFVVGLGKARRGLASTFAKSNDVKAPSRRTRRPPIITLCTAPESPHYLVWLVASFKGTQLTCVRSRKTGSAL